MKPPRDRRPWILVATIAVSGFVAASGANAVLGRESDVIRFQEAGETLGSSHGVAADSSRCPTREQIDQYLTEMSQLSVDVLQRNDVPGDCFIKAFPEAVTRVKSGQTPRGFAEQGFSWAASGLFHQPLYFEDVPLERYGHAHLLQPLHSGLKFYSSVALLPYKIGMEHPHEHIYTLGYGRPGNCVQTVREHLALSLRGAVLEAGAITGFVFLFP